MKLAIVVPGLHRTRSFGDVIQQPPPVGVARVDRAMVDALSRIDEDAQREAVAVSRS